MQSDADLVLALARGEESALGDLYDRYGGTLLSVATRLMRDGRDAEDLVHDVFVEAWRKAASFDPERGSVRAWLVTRTRSRALDRLKSPGRTRMRALDGFDVATEVADTGDYGHLSVAMAALSPEQRAVVELAYGEGLSSTEIAERLGIPVGTVKSRTAAAFSKLRVQLGAA